jgi:hypothetical protein
MSARRTTRAIIPAPRYKSAVASDVDASIFQSVAKALKKR